jgi:CBS domain-containing protein
MSCSAIMTTAPVALREDESVADAAAKLLSQHHPNLPVLDAGERYVGMFGIEDLLGLLVPRVALAGNLLSNLRFISDDPGDLRRKFRAVRNRRVGEFANRSGATLDPDAPEIEAIRLFCRGHSVLPVVEKQSRKLLGIVSRWDALRALVEPVEA